MSTIALQSLDEQRLSFSKRRFLATPLAGTIVWLIIGIAGLFLPERQVVMVLFIGTGSIVYLGLFISKFTGENFLDRSKPKNTFDRLFLYTVAMSLMVYVIAIPYFFVDHTSLTLTVGILTGLMWLPFSWIIQHWIGIFHTLSRTILIVTAWFVFPDQRFVVIPFVIVGIYIITILTLERRWIKVREIRTAAC